MPKETHYFSHDQNARHDPKISAMMSKYGIAGYGMFWVIIEMMKEDELCKLSAKSYICNAIALQTFATPEHVQDYINDCVNLYNLFEKDEHHFWSNSLLKRIEKRKEVSEKRSNAAKLSHISAKRLQSSANDLQNDANAMQSSAIKENKRKRNSSNKHSFENSPFYDYEDFKQQLPDWPEDKIKKYYDKATGYSQANGGKYLNWIAAVKNWASKDSEEIKLPQRRAYVGS